MSKDMKKMLMPILRFPEFQDAPEWQQYELKQFLTESRVLGSKGNTAKKITVKLWGKGVYQKNDEIQGSINTQYYRRTAGQFIYSKLDFLNQAFGIIPEHLNSHESTVDLPCFDVGQEINPIFLVEYVKRKDFYEKLGETADGSRKARRIHAETFLSFPIFIPRIDEQQKISECLYNIDVLISAQSQKVEALKIHKKGLMRQLFPCEGETIPLLRFTEFQDAGEWKEIELGELGELVSGLTYSPDDVRDSGLLVLRSSNVQNGEIYLEDNVYVTPNIKGANLSRPNDILICVRNGSKGLIGKNALIPEGMPLCTHGAFMTVFRTQSAKFVFQLFQSAAYQNQVDADLGATINSINGSHFIKYKFCVPRPPEQQKIADCLSSIDALVSVQSQKLAALKAHKKGLIQVLFPAADEVGA